MFALSSAMAQTAPAPSAPIPTTQSPDVTPSRPPYDPNLIPTPPAAPVAQPAPPPVIVREPKAAGQPKYTQSEIYTAYEPYGPYGPHNVEDMDGHFGSSYIPVDSWIYPEMMRLYGMGYIDTAFLAMRPWTRLSVVHMLRQSQDSILGGDNQEAQEILAVLLRELTDELPTGNIPRGAVYGAQSVYTRMMGIGGTPLRDSYHLGQTIINDYGRPYQKGFNNVTGFSSLNEWSRFSLHVRAEYQHAPSAAGYSPTLSAYVSSRDEVPYSGFNLNQDTVPSGPIAAQNPFRIVEATLSFHLAGHEFSGGKTDAWIGPGMGGGMSWSNNAENIYAFRINRVEPLHIPLVSRVLGPIRYDFFMGSLKGHTYPNHPWAHSETLEFAPTANFQFGFQRTIVFGGAGHEPVNFHTFIKGFFDVNDTTEAEKFSRDDPGARFSSFNFSYRLPLLRNYATFYADSETHDDVLPISAPRRAGYRTGLYISHFPVIKKLDLRAEAVSTDCSTLACTQGGAQYTETVQRQAYTNKGLLLGDWIGREAKGGQAWVTYHLSGNEWVQFSYLNKKTPYDFIAGGTTQNQFTASVVKRIGKDLEVNGWVQVERWKAPVYLPGLQSNTTAAVQFTWYPKLHTTPGKQ
ncbi:capsule assembly Wzi family protein [Granulicella arctica]|uniref:capsule assembly Wzi family protein n=1 Tax=Granulicella arctica TaxID=940613 RepID=UPI0021E0F4AF|nr:capsule assembly Wzi family protein [Granulicella arctica]